MPMTEKEKEQERARWALGRATRAPWFLKKKARKQKYDKAYGLLHAQKKRNRERVRRIDFPEQKKAADKRWRLANPEKQKLISERATARYLKRHPERRKRTMANWSRRNPATNIHHAQLRRARKAAVIQDIFGVARAIEGWKAKNTVSCYYCRKRISSDLMHVDHIVPLSKGGDHTPDNLCAACAACNLSKHDQLIGQWRKAGQQVLEL